MANLLDFPKVRMAIRLCAGRKDLVHGYAGELARTGKFVRLAINLGRDLRALALETTVSKDVKESTKAAILSTASLYFKQFVWDEVTYEVLAFNPWPQRKDGSFIRSESKEASGPEKTAQASTTHLSSDDLDQALEDGGLGLFEEDEAKASTTHLNLDLDQVLEDGGLSLFEEEEAEASTTHLNSDSLDRTLADGRISLPEEEEEAEWIIVGTC